MNKSHNGEAPRIIISGGGTGGHIFPAVSIANAIKELRPDAEILFVGAEGRMEMQRVPDAGYKIIGLPVAGFDRKRLWKNFAVIIKLLRSQLKARRILKEFHPQVAVGVGGYASGPTLKVAGMMGVPTLIQEQNSYAGVTNKLLAQKACKICVAYDGMEKFFPADKIIMTGNPVRQNLLANKQSREAAVTSFGFNPEKKTILILGGSLGARTINQTLIAALDTIKAYGDIQFIWQTGKIYIQQVKDAITTTTGEAVRNPRISAIPNLYVTDFIKDMASAYEFPPSAWESILLLSVLSNHWQKVTGDILQVRFVLLLVLRCNPAFYHSVLPTGSTLLRKAGNQQILPPIVLITLLLAHRSASVFHSLRPD